MPHPRDRELTLIQRPLHRAGCVADVLADACDRLAAGEGQNQSDGDKCFVHHVPAPLCLLFFADIARAG